MLSQKDTFTLANGQKIPCVGFGTWQTPSGETAVKAVRCALDAGYTHIDTAQAYENEQSVGKGIRLSGVPRKDLFILSLRKKTYKRSQISKAASAMRRTRIRRTSET